MSHSNEPVRSVKGMNDVLPADAPLWQRVEAISHEVLSSFGFREIRTNILEPTRLFSRSVGEATDIVEKEMYTFSDRSGESLTLRPEGTAGVVRAYIEHKLHTEDRISKLWYLGPMYRHERPQRGRFRQFHQVGAEILGGAEPAIDVTIIALVDTLLERLGIRKKVSLEISTLGDMESRIAFRAAIQNHFRPLIGGFCADCQRRIDTNPLRILDCKVDMDKTGGAPSGLDFLNDPSRRHFETVKHGLASAGVRHIINPRIVRGLDYYCHTVFEFVSQELGAQGTVAAGGRYDGLVEELGGPPTPGMGFAAGIERLVDLARTAGFTADEPGPAVFLVSVGEKARHETQRLALALCREGIPAGIDYGAKSLKSQMRYADRLKAKYVAVLGDSELESGKTRLKLMSDGTEREIRLDNLAVELRKG
ncbi:MAG: histidine--tRNA ligase [Deltaproteobacteria bacterium]|nr:histidine--tRNA ligase [Deltaproteobacteria bacterium]